MMTADETVQEIADLLTQALQATDPREVQFLVTQAHTMAVIRAGTTRRQVGRAELQHHLAAGGALQ